ncbi:MAG TPA: leucine-rich repeat domain-containing protein [Verrucomicrobiae bacterium]|nr:leucine-rich repeat domain-containing protein [Verrucomicrobiae bacterium]
MFGKRRCARTFCALLLLLVVKAGAEDFTYINNNGAITVTGYTGPGGNVTVPGTIVGLPVTSLDHSFYALSTVTSVTIPPGVTNIAAYTFWACTGLTNITLPDGLTTIGDAAFWECTGLTEIHIPQSVTNIGQQAFGQSTSLTAITVDPLNAWYASPDGVLFDKNQRVLIQFPSGKAGPYALPAGVTSIGDYAFWWSTALTGVTLPEGVTNIGVDAFGGCTSLATVTTPSSLTRIADSAFWGCTQLTGVVLPNSVASLGSSAFFGCASLQSITIPSNISVVGDFAFSACTGLKSVSLQNNVLGVAEFSGCTNLTGITIPDGITVIPDRAFEHTGLTNLILSSNVTRIGEFSFAECSSLTNVVLPDSLTEIGGAAFGFCTALGSVRIPDRVTTIGNGYIGKGVEGTFSACTSLTNVVLGKSLRSMGSAAFFNCPGLRSMVIPKSVTSIAEFCFGYSTNLTALYFEGDAPTVSDAFIVLSQGDPTIAYYLPGTQGWGATFASQPTAWWVLPNPVLLNTRAALTVQSNGVSLAVSWATNSSVVLEACTSLVNPTWQTVDAKPLSGGTAGFRDSQWTNYPARFYRVRGL